MGKKAEVGTPKHLANKMKAKGLQKLRWYCQMCQKQCRDENGFKCHMMSESHQRQILLFADNSKKYMDEFSYELSKEFVTILRRQFSSKRVLANRVYQEYISDRNHVHMNATRWVTLGGFVRWLGATGKCLIEETEKGWYITYIEKDPDTIAREKKREKRLKMEKDDDEKDAEFIEKQVKHALEKAGPSATEHTTPTELIRENEDEKIKINLNLEQKSKPLLMPVNQLLVKKEQETFKKPKVPEQQGRKRAIDELMEQEEIKKEKSNRKEHWLTEGIIVKIVTKSIGDEFYKAKGVVREVRDKFTAVVKLLDSGKKVKIDQAHVETVIPAVGKEVKIVNGAYRGEHARLLRIDEKNFCADLEISKGVLLGRKLKGIEYEDFSKLDQD